MNRCLFCYQPINEGEQDFHGSCSRKIFGQPVPPAMALSDQDLEALAKKVIQSQIAVTGVQAKLSLHITGKPTDKEGRRFTIVGLWGGYILKPASAFYQQLPEVEDLTMHLAQLADIKTAPHTLFRLSSGDLAYITQRLDRTKKGKLAMEDMCQLTERMTEDKYQGSYEQIAKTILKYSVTPGLDVINFFEVVLFSFLTGNADMHLKNFSLLEKPGLGLTLSPAYDLVNTALVNPADSEELALSLNGRKRKIVKQDFTAAMTTLHIASKQQQNIFAKMEKALPGWMEMIDASFLSDEFKTQYKSILRERCDRIF